MTAATTGLSAQDQPAEFPFPHRHLLGIQDLSPDEITYLLDLSNTYAEHNRARGPKFDLMRDKTLINLFFEDSTRTRTSFELAGMRLGADVINIAVANSSIKKGETIVDTAMTLNAMHADALVVRHSNAGAVKLLSEKVNCAVINGGDGSHEHPTQALLDALTIRRHKGSLQGLLVALCGDVAHSRVARSNIYLLQTMGARVRVIAPPTLIPAGMERLGVEVFSGCRIGQIPERHRPGEDVGTPTLIPPAVALIAERLDPAIFDHGGCDQQRSSQGVDAADMAVEQVVSAHALAAELGVEQEAAGAEATAHQDLVKRE